MVDCNITKNYFNEKQRMAKKRKLYAGIYKCELDCSDCPLSSLNNDATDRMTCSEFEMLCPEQAIKVVQRWSDEHPKETYLSKFMHNYPDAVLGEDGTPKRICPHEIGLNDIENREPGEHHCIECWGQPIPIEDGEE